MKTSTEYAPPRGPFEGEPPAQQQGAGEPDKDGHADQRDEAYRQADGLTVPSPVGFAELGQPSGFDAFRGEGLDGGHAADVVLEQGVQVACCVTDAEVLGSKALVPEGPPG